MSNGDGQATRGAGDENTGGVPIKFRLYVSGNYPNSIEAEFNLRVLCREHFPDKHEIEIVDVLLEPERAVSDDILLTPLLMRLSPAPVLRIVGKLNMFEPILEALGLPTGGPSKPLQVDNTSKVQGRYRVNPANGFDGATRA